MAPSKTRTVKNKHAAARSTPSSKGGRRSSSEGVSKSKKPTRGPPPASRQVKDRQRAGVPKKPKKKVYSEEELGIPKLNMVTPVGVMKPPGKKKGKVFVDDAESMTTLLAMVQAEKDGQIESKMIKARQMEAIREARKAEADKKDQEKMAKLEDAKQSLKKKRKRKSDGNEPESIMLKSLLVAGTKAAKPKKKVTFA